MFSMIHDAFISMLFGLCKCFPCNITLQCILLLKCMCLFTLTSDVGFHVTVKLKLVLIVFPITIFLSRIWIFAVHPSDLKNTCALPIQWQQQRMKKFDTPPSQQQLFNNSSNDVESGISKCLQSVYRSEVWWENFWKILLPYQVL